jgi:hypothetical protein
VRMRAGVEVGVVMTHLGERMFVVCAGCLVGSSETMS